MDKFPPAGPKWFTLTRSPGGHLLRGLYDDSNKDRSASDARAQEAFDI